ncbi:MAG: L-alanine-DL-glutamate epimerase-like enolase superfamily enzyme, partial [Gammaproteobacteria bacterium]
MNITSIHASALAIAFKQSFNHASAARAAGQSLWVQVRSDCGHVGYGEGCPREYVSGETVAGCLAFVAQYEAHWRQVISDIASLRVWVDAHHELIDRHPSAWSAVELALLDLFAQGAGCSVEHALNSAELDGRFRYTAVLGDASPERFSTELARYTKAGFCEFKVKLSGDLARDRSKVLALRKAGIAASAVRADANNLWADAQRAIAHLLQLDFAFRALEEPLGVGDYAGMARIAAACSSAIIVDESVLRIDQLEALVSPTAWIINLRVSKMGGLLRSLRMVDEIRRAGLGLIIGAHVGETSVLTRAALTVANASRDVLLAQEGAFGTHLLTHDVLAVPVMFGAGGILD